MQFQPAPRGALPSNARKPAPWPGFTVWEARRSRGGFWRPGACVPSRCPKSTNAEGSLNSIQSEHDHPGARCKLHVIGKARGCIAIGPASSIFQNLWQVPVVERNKRADFGFQQGIDEATVIIDAFRIRELTQRG